MATKKSKQSISFASVLSAWRTPLLSTLLMLILVFAGALYLRNLLKDPNSFPLQLIEVKGEFSHLDRGHLEQVVAKSMGGGFFTTDIHRIQQAVQKLPWVHSVYITRHWPDKLVMQVVEQVPLANWQDNGLVNIEGEIFTPEHRDEKIELHLYGADDEAKKVVAFYRKTSALIQGRDLKIVSFGRDRHRDWIVAFESGLKITMGRDRAAEKLSNFLTLLPAILTQGKQAEIVDLRYEQGFTVRWVDAPEQEINDGAA